MPQPPERKNPRKPRLVSDVFRPGAERRLWLQLGFGRLVIRLMVVALVALAAGLLASKSEAGVAPSAASLTAATTQARRAPTASPSAPRAASPRRARAS